MSLINQMLQDLEKRQPGVLTSTPPPMLVAVPTPPRRIHPVWWAVPLLAIVAGLLVWLVALPPATKVVAVTTPAVVHVVSPISAIQPPPPTVAPLPSGNVAQVSTTPAPIETAVVIPLPRASVLPEQMRAPRQAKEPAAMALATNSQVQEMVSADLDLTRASADRPKPKAQTRTEKMPPPLATSAGERQATTAVTVTKQIKEMTPQQQAENEYRKAVAMVQQGRMKEAVEELTYVLQLDSRHTAARQTLVGLLLEANRYGDAERKLQEGLAISPEQPELVMILARLQVERGDVRGALASLERTLPYASENPPYQAFLSALLQREGRHREAIAHYLLALRNAPQTGVWLMGLGISLQAENRLPEAREAFSRARTSNTLSPELQAFVEQRLKQLGQ